MSEWKLGISTDADGEDFPAYSLVSEWHCGRCKTTTPYTMAVDSRLAELGASVETFLEEERKAFERTALAQHRCSS